MNRETGSPGRPPGKGSTHRGCVRPTSGPCLGPSRPPARRGGWWYGHLPWPLTSQPWGTSLGAPVPLLAQEVLELVHELLRVEVVVTPGARRRVTRRIIVLL